MNIALCIRGIHYELSDTRNLNYKNSLENYRKFIINNLKEFGNEVHTFIITYHSEIEEQLVDDFEPNSITFNTYNSKDSSYICSLNQYIQMIDMIKIYEEQHHIKYDTIIIIRFDLIFFRKITEMNIDYNKFNICMKHSSGNADGDFWILPRNYIENFRIILNNRLEHENTLSQPDFFSTLHSINHFIDKDIIHYMYNIDATNYNNGTCNQYYYIIGSSHSFVQPIRDVVYSLNQYMNTNINSTYLKYDY
jgi:hypothetical protein